jgi:hypothetical protein
MRANGLFLERGSRQDRSRACRTRKERLMPEAILRVSAELFVDFFKEGPPRTWGIIGNPLPDDARLLDVQMRSYGGPPIVFLTLESDAFPEADFRGVPAELPPVMAKLITRHDFPQPTPPPQVIEKRTGGT